MKDIGIFKDKYKGEDIYVIGSGPSCDYIDNNFLKNKISVGTNQTYRKFETDYIVRKEHSLINDTLKNSNSNIVVARLNCGSGVSIDINKNTERLYYFNHLANVSKINLSAFEKPNHLVVSDSTITSSIHFAYHLGAKNIILIGVDHGLLDEKHTFDGYYKTIKETPWRNWEDYKKWLNILERDTLSLKKKLKELGVNVYSLNPFINFKLEGHVYKG
jgi:hypothetical protein